MPNTWERVTLSSFCLQHGHVDRSYVRNFRSTNYRYPVWSVGAPSCFSMSSIRAVILNLGLIEPRGFGESVSGVAHFNVEEMSIFYNISTVLCQKYISIH